jgi:hypothetical protein
VTGIKLPSSAPSTTHCASTLPEGQNASLLPALKLKAFTFTSQFEAV